MSRGLGDVYKRQSLYSEDLATFGEDSVYDQADSAGFIHLFGLPITEQAKLKEKLAAEKE